MPSRAIPGKRVWIDDMFMITTIQSQAYLATGDRKYIDRAAAEMAMYLEKIQRPNSLFYHAPAPFFWARGNGWMAAGMSRLLSVLPKDNPNRPVIMEAYKDDGYLTRKSGSRWNVAPVD